MTTRGQLVIAALASNRHLTKRYAAFVKPEYFETREERLIFSQFKDFVSRYSGMPTKDAIEIAIDQSRDLTDAQRKDIQTIIDDIWSKDVGSNIDWLQTTIEEFCQERALYLAILKSSELYNEDPKSWNAIPNLVSEALSLTFDNTVGGDMDDYEDRFDRYQDTSARIPFNIDALNVMTRGGLPGKRTMLIGAGTNVGKSAWMCSMAAHNWRCGHNVLYISAEIDEDEVFQRIEGNVLDIAVNSIADLPKDDYIAKMKRLYQKMPGRLKVKEYPMGTTTVFQFHALLDELKLKDNFVPDIVYVDYLGVFLSHRASKTSGMYDTGKYVAEDLRAFAQQHRIPVVSAFQLNRGGYSSSDPDLDDTAESFAVTHSADLIIMVTQSDEMAKEGKFSCFLRKNRLGSKKINHFIVGVNVEKQQIFDLNLRKDIDDAYQRRPAEPSKKQEEPPRSSLRRLKTIR